MEVEFTPSLWKNIRHVRTGGIVLFMRTMKGDGRRVAARFKAHAEDIVCQLTNL